MLITFKRLILNSPANAICAAHTVCAANRRTKP